MALLEAQGFAVGEELSLWAGTDTTSHMVCCSGTGTSATAACRTGLQKRDLCSPLEQTQTTPISTSEQINTWSAQIPVLGTDMDRARLDVSHNLHKLKHIQCSVPTSDTLVAPLAGNPVERHSCTTFLMSRA